MDYKKMSDLGVEELIAQKIEFERQLKELLLNSSLTNMEKPHLKRSLKISIAQANGLLAKGDK